MNNVSWTCSVATGAYKNLVDELFIYGAPESGSTTLTTIGPRILIAKGEQSGGSGAAITGEAMVAIGTRPKMLPPGNPGLAWNASGRFRGAFPLYYEEFEALWALISNPTMIRPKTIRLEMADGEHRAGSIQQVLGIALVS